MKNSACGILGWLVGTEIKKRCGPSIPCPIEVRKLTVVLCPGSRVVEPTTGLGGQHPSSVCAVAC